MSASPVHGKRGIEAFPQQVQNYAINPRIQTNNFGQCEDGLQEKRDAQVPQVLVKMLY